MKSVKDTMLERRSIRRYERQAISDEDIAFIHEAIRNTPTSYNGQQYSIVEVVSQPLKEQLAEIIGQKQIKTCNRFLMFCADFHKIAVLAKAKGVEMPEVTMTADGVLVGVIDAALAMMSAVTAAGALGLGACCIGYARTAAPECISSLLGLPKGVFGVCGLAIGVPRELPDLKPKQPVGLLVHTDRYSPDADMLPALEEYNREVTHYNATRAGDKTANDWCAHIVDYYHHVMSYEILAALRRQGFDVRK